MEQKAAVVPFWYEEALSAVVEGFEASAPAQSVLDQWRRAFRRGNYDQQHAKRELHAALDRAFWSYLRTYGAGRRTIYSDVRLFGKIAAIAAEAVDFEWSGRFFERSQAPDSVDLLSI